MRKESPFRCSLSQLLFVPLIAGVSFLLSITLYFLPLSVWEHFVGNDWSRQVFNLVDALGGGSIPRATISSFVLGIPGVTVCTMLCLLFGVDGSFQSRVFGTCLPPSVLLYACFGWGPASLSYQLIYVALIPLSWFAYWAGSCVRSRRNGCKHDSHSKLSIGRAFLFTLVYSLSALSTYAHDLAMDGG